MSRQEDQRQAEMERGRIISGRATRESDLARYQAGKKVQVMVALPGHPYYEARGQVNLFNVDGVDIAHENILADDYPSEVLLAKISLAVSATVGYEGIPAAETLDPEERKRRNEYRDRFLGHWRDQ